MKVINLTCSEGISFNGRKSNHNLYLFLLGYLNEMRLLISLPVQETHASVQECRITASHIAFAVQKKMHQKPLHQLRMLPPSRHHFCLFAGGYYAQSKADDQMEGIVSALPNCPQCCVNQAQTIFRFSSGRTGWVCKAEPICSTVIY